MMARYIAHEVDATYPEIVEILRRFNSLVPEWPLLEERHFSNGFWWIIYNGDDPVAFAGLTPMHPFIGYGYLKRCYVAPDHHGHGLQFRLMMARELKARQIGWTHLISEHGGDNSFSAANFRKAGFEPTDPEQRWGVPGSIYWVKRL
jgi:GNAT superfamily N-acetyltransferase